jgi:hypothetical protein
LKRRRPDRYTYLYLYVTGASAAQIGQRRPWAFFARQIGWIENRRATHAHRLVPGMLRFSHFATKGEIRRKSSGVAVDLRRWISRAAVPSPKPQLSLIGWIDNGAPSIRPESTRNERKTRRSGRHPMIWAPNRAYSKQRDETEAYEKSWITVARDFHLKPRKSP